MKSLFTLPFVTLIFLGACQTIPSGQSGGGVKKKVAVHGHRGSRGTHPENTLPAFEEAIAAGADVWELDLQLTKDNVLVVGHDPEITGKICRDKKGQPVKKPVLIRTLTLTQIKQFECGNIRQERFPDQQLLPNVRIPTLDEVLQLRDAKAPKVELNIETKMSAPNPKNNPDPELFVKKIIEVLKKYGAVEATILQSFDFRTLRVAKTLEPKLRLSALFEEEKQNVHFCELTLKEGAQYASPNFKLLNAEEVANCHKNNIQVAPWTLNTEPEWIKALGDGVDAIITDYPRKLTQFLSAK